MHLCLFLSSKCYDLSQVVLIIIYCVLLAITFLVEDFLYADTNSSISNTSVESCAGMAVSPDPSEDVVEVDKSASGSLMEYKFVTLLLLVSEAILLLFFCLDIALHVIGYGMIYLRDYWNLFDAAVIILNIAFVILDS